MEGLMSTLVTALGSAAWAELGLAWGVEDDIRTLGRRMSTVSAVLRDAEARAINEEALRKWLADLKEVAFDAEDALDEVQIEAALREGKKEKVLCYLCSMFSTPLYRNRMARKIKGIAKRFDEVAEDRGKFHLAERAAVVAEREEFSCPPLDEIFGRNDDRDKVMQWLTEVDDGRDVSVLPIVGLGGLGKTTLARMVYNDERTVKHFETRIWVFVGKIFDLKAIAKAMLERVAEAQSVSTLDGMYSVIRERVTNKRYLLILDDVWCEDRLKLERLKDMLSGSAHGNKTVVTTRSREVATIMGTTESGHMLKGLTYDDCWLLFKHRAFGPGRAEESPNLVKFGRDIVRKCGGVPLAAKSLGGLMATKKQEEEWLAIANSEIWNLNEESDGILPALQLSYDHLSPQLKRCFAYCSVFPKDREIQKLRLIQLWMSHGFIQPNGTMNLEDIGTQYFNTLLNRSFFQDEEEDQYGNIESCKMHDLVHDLACFVAKDESSVVKVDERIGLPQGCRYSSTIYHDGLSPSIAEIASEANKLRSFSLLSEIEYALEKKDFDDTKFSKEISKLTRLRALHLDCTSGGNIVSVLSGLKHLRFLELSSLKVEALPDSITDLRNLQTLNLGECEGLKELPESMMLMSNLRHLVMHDCRSLAGMPRGIGRLTNLQTMPLFRVGGEERHASIAELRHLNQIRGGLTIDGLGNVKDPKDAEEASLSSKSGLLTLELCWGEDGEASASCVDVLENLQPHRNMKSLDIYYYRGSRLPKWFTNLPSLSLPNLAILELRGLTACEELPPLGQLPSLKQLHLSGMNAIKKVGKEMYVESTLTSTVPIFPSLKRMALRGAANLEEWWVPERGAFPSLQSLDIEECPKLRMLGSMPSSSVANLEFERGLDEQNQPPPSFLSLSRLDIRNCGRLAVLPEWLRGVVSLKNLQLRGCRDLQMLPDWIQRLSRLEQLSIEGCVNLRMLPEGIQHLSGLQELHLSRCSSLQMLPDGIQHLSGLQELEIEDCDNLQMLPDGIQRLSGLQRLHLSGLPSLQMLPEGIQHLSRLESLWIRSCPNLQMLPEGIQHLSGLQELEIEGFPNLRMLPDGIQHLSGLKELGVVDCPSLEMLPEGIQHLSGLQSLRLSGCPKLQMLPDGFQHLSGLKELSVVDLPNLQMLPDGIQHLSRLEQLLIQRCPHLERRCERVTGEDWFKVSHIPHLYIFPLELPC